MCGIEFTIGKRNWQEFIGINEMSYQQILHKKKD
jgi:hypothetical protein